MSAESPNQIPPTLYRGTTLPIDQVNEGLLNSDIRPGAEPQIDEAGRQVVADGNEYGVYMSTNKDMSETAYATPMHGDTIPDSPSFNWGGASQSRVQMPRVGVMYEIDTKGMDVRKPRITSNLQGHYNNGFEGDEFIADSVPAANHRIAKLKIGADVLHPEGSIEVGDSPLEAFAEVRKEAAYRSGRLVLASQVISEIPGKNRHFPGVAERALAKIE